MSTEAKVYMRIPCDPCDGTGKIEIHSTAGGPDGSGPVSFYDYRYCEDCKGAGFYEAWIGIVKFKAMLERLG